jgi:Fe-S cluster assembly protein SufD
MNMRPNPAPTPAEAALVEAFAARISDLPGDGEVTTRRDNAVEAIKAGLPSRRVEAWHYTDLRRLLYSVPDFDPTAKVKPLAPLVEGARVLPVLNGVSAPDVPAIEGATVRRVPDLLADGTYAPALEPQDAADAIGAINVAFVSDGYLVEIADGAELEAPVELQNVMGPGQSHVRFPVKVGAGARATIVERQAGEAAGFATSVSNLVVGDGAEIVWVIVQEEALDATYLGQFNAWIGKDAKLTLFVMNAGGKLVRQEVRVAAKGDGGAFRLRGVNLLAGETHCDVTMVLDHEGYGATSTEIVRNIVLDRAQGVFQGQIRVAREAQKTDAKMACNTLLLTDEGEFSTKPELEIFADDVACGHGATVAEIDTNHLFYLMARGIPEKEARGLLVKAFLAEVIEELDSEALVAALEQRLDGWFAEHG